MPEVSGRFVFLPLIGIELLLLAIALRSSRRLAGVARVLVFAVPLGLVLVLRAWQAFGVLGVLDWDETYYLSVAVTAAAGRGLYPYILGYGPMTAMGGIGYAAYLYAFAVRAFGPTILALRGVSLIASIAALVGLWKLARLWYGSGSAWAAVAFAAAFRLFAQSNTVRMDSLAFAWTVWALYCVALAWSRPVTRWRDLVAGVIFGIGLEVHIDTAVTAMACCAVYLLLRRWRPLALFISGELAAVVGYVCANVLPDPSAFYRTAVLLRLGATRGYSTGTNSLAGSFLNPALLMAKEGAAYRALWVNVPHIEIAIVLLAFAAAAWRRTHADRIALTLAGALLVAAAIVLDNAAPEYFVHITPALLVPVGALFAVGFARRDRLSTAEVTPIALTVFSLVIAVVIAGGQPAVIRTIVHGRDQIEADRAFASQVRAVVDRRCTLAGDAGLYVRYFPDYPFFISTRRTEVTYAMLYFSSPSERAYWRLKRPDVVFGEHGLPDPLASYVSDEHFEQRAPNVWMRAGGCRGGP
ncbi:MAG: glycosyltransferase family 39 protein [Vicinamibacterales bacterium]